MEIFTKNGNFFKIERNNLNFFKEINNNHY